MRIAVVADSHDQIPNLRRAIERANQERAELLLHCGDLISPFMLACCQQFRGPVHLIYGNNAGDQHLIASRCSAQDGPLHHHGAHGTITVGTLRIALEHYPRWARALACSGQYDLVCYGHTHLFHAERLEGCLLLNPGELLGKDADPSFALVDTARWTVQRIVVGKQWTPDD